MPYDFVGKQALARAYAENYLKDNRTRSLVRKIQALNCKFMQALSFHHRKCDPPQVGLSAWAFCLLISGVLSIGCKPPPKSRQGTNLPIQSSRPERIIAQGQIQPSGGLIRLNGLPGDAVEEILVAIGDPVTPGKPLLRLRSATLRKMQLETLREQLLQAELQQAAGLDRAKLELTAARSQLSQAQEQARSVQRREESLPLLKQQWEDARTALKRAEAIANDPLTKAMISRLEIDKQRASVTTSQLQFEQQRESSLMAVENVQWAEKLALEKAASAEKALELAEKASPAALIRSQIKGAEQQLEAATIVSPITGEVVSLDARVGENVAMFPLIQVADLTKMNCQVEIYQTDAPLVKEGQAAELRSNAFEKPLHGKVVRIDRLVGFPQLRSTDPLAKVDYRTLPVLIEIASEEVAAAARWLQLQVEVEITLNSGGP